MKNLNLESNLSGDEESSEDTVTCNESPPESLKSSTSPASKMSGAKPDKGGARPDKTGASVAAASDGKRCDKVRQVDPEPEKGSSASGGGSAGHIRVSMDDFQILKVLGKGAYGKVFQVRKTKGPGSPQIYAMKAMDKSRICGSRTDVRHTKAERNVLVSVDHPFIVRLKFAFETPKRLYLVQEFCCGGELFRRMEVERLMVESVAKFYLQEIILALEYLHSLDIVYRDLKTENVMLDKEGHVKLIDFGLSKTDMKDDSLTHTFCGTVEYMAPEVILKDPGYGKPADWWSFGVFTFDLLTGRSPFHSNQGKHATKERILKGKFATPRVITPDANDFVRKLLRRPVDRRLGTKDGADELKAHPFFRDTDWDRVLEGDYPPPYLPEVSSETDVQNFDTMFTSRTPRESNNTSLTPETQEAVDGLRFEDFDYVAGEFLQDNNDTPVSRQGSTGKDVVDQDRRSSCGGATTSGVSSGASSVSHSVSADSLDSGASKEINSKDPPKAEAAKPATATTEQQQGDRQQPEQDQEDPEINELRICSHGS